MNIEHTPVGEFLACPLFGMHRTALAVSTSNHPVLDIMALATSSWKPMYSFQSEDIACPACNDKHRPHTNKEGCKKFKKSEHAPAPAKAVPKKNVMKPIQPDSELKYRVSLLILMMSRWWPLDTVPVPRTESPDVGNLSLKKTWKSNRNQRPK